ncbi:hypothetical protein BKA64DRAFT_482361 [Cadophora sp. MPI-SDFR-AT-0126]|nr:hypothetical protein BKA64DRAFT_482361 [Leotiomycetes sp. MPI-SDFR-AT-0126]
MAEAVGLAASIASLVAIVGQVGKSVLFIKGFFEDIKNAPDDIRSLAEEIEMLASAAQKTKGLLVKYQETGLGLDVENECKALKRYVGMVERLGVKIEKDVKKFGDGKGRWWQRMQSAARKKELAGFLKGLERTKTLVMGIEMKIAINLQHDQRDSLTKTNHSLDKLQSTSETNATILNQMNVQSTTIMNWTGTADRTLFNLSSGIEAIQSDLTEVGTAIQNLASVHGEKLSALELMLESAVARGLKKHHEEFGQTYQSISLRRGDNSNLNREKIKTCTEDHNNELYCHSFEMIRRDKTIHESSFRTPFFDIEIMTKEVQRKPRSVDVTPLTTLSRDEPTHSQRFTTYHVQVKIPFWRGGMTYHPGNMGMMYGGSLCKSFRTYNIVPSNAPIIRACYDFDLPKVRWLFEAGLASPLDCDSNPKMPLVLKIFASLFWGRVAVGSKAIELLRFLICCLGGDIGSFQLMETALMVDGYSAEMLRNSEVCDAQAEAVRLVIMNSSDDPLEGCNEFLTIELSRSHIYPVLLSQEQWWLDDTISLEEAGFENCWIETDLQMLKDPKGLYLQKALLKGLMYAREASRNVPIHLLLKLAEKTREEDFHQCVLSRLVILLKHGSDPRRVHLFTRPYFPWGLSKKIRSCTAYALEINLLGLWETALMEAGWTQLEIQDLFEEELYLGIPDLVNGVLKYQTRDEQRKQFIETLRQGGFAYLDEDQLFNLSDELDCGLGLPSWEISAMVREVASILKLRATPGGWPEDQATKLMPGKDFKLPERRWVFEAVKDWNCICEIWDEELGGCIPGEQKDNDDEIYQKD